jgi:four helix bundle protein
MTIKRFQDIRAWQEARTLTRGIYALAKTSPGLRRDRRLLEQLQSASVSVMSNIAEGFSRRTDKEFVQSLFISKSSAAEVQSLLYVALDQQYIVESEFSALDGKAEEVAEITSGFITSLTRRPARSRTQRLNGLGRPK